MWFHVGRDPWTYVDERFVQFKGYSAYPLPSEPVHIVILDTIDFQVWSDSNTFKEISVNKYYECPPLVSNVMELLPDSGQHCVHRMTSAVEVNTKFSDGCYYRSVHLFLHYWYYLFSKYRS